MLCSAKPQHVLGRWQFLEKVLNLAFQGTSVTHPQIMWQSFFIFPLIGLFWENGLESPRLDLVFWTLVLLLCMHADEFI